MAETKVYAKVALTDQEYDYLQMLLLCQKQHLQVPSGIIQDLEKEFGKQYLSEFLLESDAYDGTYAFFLITSYYNADYSLSFDITVSDVPPLARAYGIRVVITI